jgi:pimeloyl-ACP methyl ester carboxylesterase
MADMVSVFKSPEGEAENLAAYECVLSQWPVSYEELYASTQFGATHVIMSGPHDGKPVLLLHGQDSCAISWIYNVADLSRTFRVFAVDTIGDIGKSKRIHQPNTREEYAKWVLEVVEQLEIERTDLIGLSYGGFLAANFALAYPGRVNRMVLLSPGIPNFGPPTFQWANYGMPMMLFPSRFTIKRFINGISVRGYSPEDPVQEQMIIGIMNMQKVSFMRPVFRDEEFQRITTPILLMIGDHEIMYEPRKALDRAARLIPGIKTELVPNASHMLNGDQVEMVNTRILKFLE